jgi:ATP-dependent RNA helicase DDX19/DBP5
VIFVQKKSTAKNLVAKLLAEDHKVGLFSSDLDSKQRDAVMDDFEREDGKTRVLVATNVLSRGVDGMYYYLLFIIIVVVVVSKNRIKSLYLVKNLNLVVNYDMPLLQNGKPDPETYLHRIGRTGEC